MEMMSISSQVLAVLGTVSIAEWFGFFAAVSVIHVRDNSNIGPRFNLSSTYTKE